MSKYTLKQPYKKKKKYFINLSFPRCVCMYIYINFFVAEHIGNLTGTYLEETNLVILEETQRILDDLFSRFFQVPGDRFLHGRS